MKEFNLDKEPKIKSGFTAPADYFKNLPAEVLRKLPASDHKVISIFARKATWIYAVAAVFIMALSIPLYNLLNPSTAELDKATMENYLAAHENISNDDIAELLDVEDLQKIKIHSDIENNTIEDVLATNANLEEYLIN